MQSLAVAGTILWFSLVASLWYAKPGDAFWFLGSMILGIGYFSAFFWYVTRPK